jgi:hypothetical protein
MVIWAGEYSREIEHAYAGQRSGASVIGVNVLHSFGGLQRPRRTLRG